MSRSFQTLEASERRDANFELLVEATWGKLGEVLSSFSSRTRHLVIKSRGALYSNLKSHRIFNFAN